MSDTVSSTLAPSRAAKPQLDTALVWLMALTCGLVVANIYYNQPLLAAIGRTFHISDSRASLIATATQVGYTLGMLLVVPLGDMLERKRLMLWMLLGAALCLGAAAVAPTFALLAGASILLGICSAVPQLLLPMAAHLAPEADRGRIVGRIMSGLLIGILLSRTVSGYVGAHLGWRTVFEGAAGVMLALAALLAWRLPQDQPHFEGTYASLMQSLGTLVRELPPLRRSALVGASIFAAFSVFWTTLARKPGLWLRQRCGWLLWPGRGCGRAGRAAGWWLGRPARGALRHHSGHCTGAGFVPIARLGRGLVGRAGAGRHPA
jgi:predicted MFS family arabinose efflux permease